MWKHIEFLKLIFIFVNFQRFTISGGTVGKSGKGKAELEETKKSIEWSL